LGKILEGRMLEKTAVTADRLNIWYI